IAVVIAKGALQEMIPAPLKILSAFILLVTMLASSTFLLPSSAQEESAPRPEVLVVADQAPKAEPKAVKKPRQCVILWMSGGPSQIDTFDPKAGNIAMFKAIPTTVKGVQFSETLPQLAKQANHLA